MGVIDLVAYGFDVLYAFKGVDNWCMDMNAPSVLAERCQMGISIMGWPDPLYCS